MRPNRPAVPPAVPKPIVAPSSSPTAILPNTQCLPWGVVTPRLAGPVRIVQPEGVVGALTVSSQIVWAIRTSFTATTAGQAKSNEAPFDSVPAPAPAEE